MTSGNRFHTQPAGAVEDAGPILPEPFADLAPWAQDWSIRTERARAEKRLSTPIARLREFHAATVPRLEAIIQYLNT
ncbi:MAG: hypothetical protein LH617_00405, partial [Ramlibacter sp.]|nr:hypothetical protein [Ramlibacter sp.]